MSCNTQKARCNCKLTRIPQHFPRHSTLATVPGVLGSTPTFRRRLIDWYRQNHRDLPWRVRSGYPDPYHVLVSELMLQQTQVATVIPYFNRFIDAFPDMAALAQAEESQVLRLWQGLGYYRRARHLRRAAQAVVQSHNGRLPREVEQLLELPGIGRYTAGAIASLAYGQATPILDGNVIRVLCRLDKIETDPTDRDTLNRLWSTAEQLTPKQNAGDFNSAMMELGALVCVPKSPRCLTCPVQKHCEAYAAQLQDRIPLRKSKSPTPLHRRWTFCIASGNQWLLEQRPTEGRWASMWQFVTLPAMENVADPTVRSALPVPVSPPRLIGSVRHALTHRRYEFDIFRCRAKSRKLPKSDTPRRWLTLQETDKLPMSRPQLKVAALLQLGTSEI